MDIKNSKIIGTIYETTDYDIFKKLPNNRDVINQRKQRIMNSIKEGYVLNPIVINKDYQIIDGQGRYEALKELGLPIRYIVDEEAGIEECRRMNAYNTSWNVNDYIKSLAEGGNESCKNLLAIMMELGLPAARCIRLACRTNNQPGKSVYENMSHIIFTPEDKDVVRHAWKCVCEIRDALQLQRRINETFIVAVKVMIDTKGYNHSSMINHCKKLKVTFAMQANLENALKEFSRIYNSGKAASSRLYFEDYMRNKGYNAKKYDEYGIKGDVSTL